MTGSTCTHELEEYYLHLQIPNDTFGSLNHIVRPTTEEITGGPLPRPSNPNVAGEVIGDDEELPNHIKSNRPSTRSHRIYRKLSGSIEPVNTS